MDFQTIVSNGLGDTLKCSVCTNYLSYFPISLCSNDQHICGRCTVPDGLTSFMDTPYETLAQFVKFPCRYSSEGCFEELLPQKVEHEENCPFRVVECIVEKPNKCEWKGSLATLFQHCKNEHSPIILEEGEFEVSVDSTQEYDYLIEVKDSFFVFRRKFDVENRILEFKMFNNHYNADRDSYDFKMKAQNGEKSISMNFQSRTSVKHPFRYFDLKYITTESHEEVKIKISKKKNSDLASFIQKYNFELLKVLKCSNCSSFLIPPIYQCMEKSNDYFCSSCKSEHAFSNSYIRTKFFTQSVVLEKITSLVTYPCDNYTNGCFFSGTYPEIKTHQLGCGFKKRKCPFIIYGAKTCTWEGLERDIYQHVLENPNKHILNELTSDFTLPFNKQLGRYGRFVHFGGRLFLFLHEVKNSDHVWSLSKVSQCNYNFRYEVIMVDRTNQGSRLLIGKQCCNNFEEFASNVKKSVANEDYECIVNHDQFSSVFKEEKSKPSTYSLRIFKC